MSAPRPLRSLPSLLPGALIEDIVRIVDPLEFDRAALLAVLRRRLAARRSEGAGATAAEERAALNADLQAVLRGRMPRRRAVRRPGARADRGESPAAGKRNTARETDCGPARFCSRPLATGTGRCRRSSGRSSGWRRRRTSTRC